MKHLIFSDSHLTDRFEEDKFKFLYRIISQSGRVIINGDFWDGYLTSFDKFIKSPWKKLFPLLLKKKTIYIYGNHDSPDLSDQRVNLFSIKQTEKYFIVSGEILLRIEHGQNIFKIGDKKLPLFVLELRTYMYDLIRFYFFKKI